jgi:hypothetical protein
MQGITYIDEKPRSSEGVLSSVELVSWLVASYKGFAQTFLQGFLFSNTECVSALLKFFSDIVHLCFTNIFVSGQNEVYFQAPETNVNPIKTQHFPLRHKLAYD